MDLRADLLSYTDGDLTGWCYVASEALYHLLGGRTAGLTPMVIHHEGGTHWYLRNKEGEYIDLTEEQFLTPVPHPEGRGCGFLTRQPSRKTQEFLDWRNTCSAHH